MGKYVINMADQLLKVRENAQRLDEAKTPSMIDFHFKKGNENDAEKFVDYLKKDKRKLGVKEIILRPFGAKSGGKSTGSSVSIRLGITGEIETLHKTLDKMKNRFYSPMALYLIIENKLVKDPSKISELFDVFEPKIDYANMDEDNRIKLLVDELSSTRSLLRIGWTYSDLTTSELDILKEASRARITLGPQTITTAIISNTQSVSDVLELAVLLK